MESKPGILREKSYAFALRIVKLARRLAEEKKEFVLSKQILRSGTSIGANAAEANQAQSKSDFIHKLSISNKESFETEYWLMLLRDSGYLAPTEAEGLIADCCELQRILTASIKTSEAANGLFFPSSIFNFQFSLQPQLVRLTHLLSIDRDYLRHVIAVI